MGTDLVISIKSKLYDFRGYKVMLDRDLGEYYGVLTKVLNKAVKRNLEIFPSDFMFQLTDEETEQLRFQFGTPSAHGGFRYNPHVFTEKGAWTLAFILRSPQARQKGIQLIRVLEQLRDVALQNQALLAPSVQSQITSPSSVTNIFYAPVNIHQQGSHNKILVNSGELILDLLRMKEQTRNHEVIAKIDEIAAKVAKGQKSEVIDTLKAISTVAKTGSALFKFGEQVGKLLAPWVS
jgi:hypothetical protein